MLLEAISAIASGGLGTLIGTATSLYQSHQEAKENEKIREHQLKERALDMQEMEKESELILKQMSAELQGKKDIAKIELIQKEQEIEKDLIVANYQHDTPAQNIAPWVANFRAAYRPGLATLLFSLTTAIYFSTNDMTLKTVIVNAVIIGFTNAISFYFVDRSKAKKAGAV